jgi:uncharacterized phage protein (TIGR01671 family)
MSKHKPRELRFRAWHEGTGRMLYWNGDFFDVAGPPYVYLSWDDAAEAGLIEQFTGLRDRNGIEIWEGDYVTTSMHDDIEYFAVVAFGHDDIVVDKCDDSVWVPTYGWYMCGVWNCNEALFRGAVFVRGNIHENPEMTSSPRHFNAREESIREFGEGNRRRAT